MRDAIKSGDDESLAESLSKQEYWKHSCPIKPPGMTTVYCQFACLYHQGV